MSYLIFSDVSLDIDKNFADSHDVRYVPMEYVLGDETFHCDKPESDSMMHNYYEKLRQKVKTQTSQITPCLLYTSPSPRDSTSSRMPSSA